MQRTITWMYVCACAVWGAGRGEAVELRCAGEDSPRCRYSGGSRLNSHEKQFHVEDHKILFSYEDSRYLEVTCNGWAALDSAALPSFSSALRVPRVTLSDCPPPDVGAGGSFARTLLALNVTLLRSRTQGNLTLVSLPPHPPLRAELFVGLEDLIELKLIAKFNPRQAGERRAPVAGFLAALSSLRTLVVQGVRLPPGELDFLPTSLRSLSLRATGVERIPEDVALPDLHQLVLSEDTLTEFALPPTLITLSLESKNTTFHTASMSADLETLLLVKWSVAQLVPLSRCMRLVTLSLLSPAMEELPPRWVALCHKLEVLRITNAKFTSLPADLLENSTALRELSLTHGVLETLPTGLLDYVPNLRVLDLTKNRIHTLPSGMFATPVTLQTLNLSKNLLASDAMDMLAGLYSLVTLNLDNNPRLFDLCDYPGDKTSYSRLLKLTKLTSLSLRNTNVTRICRDWCENMTFLRTLDLRNTNISELRISDLQYTRDDTVKDAAEVLLDGAPVVSVLYNEEDYKKSQIAVASGAKVQLDEHSSLKCDCNMYWTRLALFPANNSTRVPTRVTGLRCSDKRALQEVPPEDMLCPADVMCREAGLPDSCMCSGRPEAGRRVLLRVQCEGAALTSVPKLNTLSYIDYDLRLANNNITELHIADLPANWMKLDIRNNSLKVVDAEVGRALVGSRRRLQLAGNPLECSCSAAPLLLALHTAGAPASDLHSASCYGGGALHDASTTLCARVPFAAWLAIVLATLLAVTASIVAYFAHPKHRILIKILLHRLGLRRLPPEPPAPKEGFLYDAFLCFSHKDQEIVDEIVKKLEKGPNQYKFCVHCRNFVPGRLISDQIAYSMRVSRRIVVIVSRDYFKSNWAQAEFREANALGLRDCTSRLVIILLEDPAKLPLDDDLKSYIKKNTYGLWGSMWFWETFRHALGDPLSSRGQRTLTSSLVTVPASLAAPSAPGNLASTPLTVNSSEQTVPEHLVSGSSDTAESSFVISAHAASASALQTTHAEPAPARCVVVREREHDLPSPVAPLPCRRLAVAI